jgi:hypothetical protein
VANTAKTGFSAAGYARRAVSAALNLKNTEESEKT